MRKKNICIYIGLFIEYVFIYIYKNVKLKPYDKLRKKKEAENFYEQKNN